MKKFGLVPLIAASVPGEAAAETSASSNAEANDLVPAIFFVDMLPGYSTTSAIREHRQ